jgi:hypothetical protein
MLVGYMQVPAEVSVGLIHTPPVGRKRVTAWHLLLPAEETFSGSRRLHNELFV